MNKPMKRNLTLLFFAVLFSASYSRVAIAQTLVDAEWLSENSKDPELVLLHVGSPETYQSGHIPGAQRIDGHRDLSHHDSHSEGSLILEMPPAKQLETVLEGLGISNNSSIVIYWSDDQITEATRALFTLVWAGLGENVNLLDGGLDAWVNSGHSLTDKTSDAPVGNLTLSPRSELIVDANWVGEHSTTSGIAVVDARSRAHFEGVMRSRGLAGHIPGAGSIPWTELVNHDLEFRDNASLREIFSDAGVAPGATVVAYCHIGQFATTVLFAANQLGHPVKLYDGAFQDWASRDLPVIAE